MNKILNYVSAIGIIVTLIGISMLIVYGSSDQGVAKNILIAVTVSGLVSLFTTSIVIYRHLLSTHIGTKWTSNIIQIAIIITLIIGVKLKYIYTLYANTNTTEYGYESATYLSYGLLFFAFTVLLYFIANQFATRFIGVSRWYTGISITVLFATSILLIINTLNIINIFEIDYDLLSKVGLLSALYSGAGLVALPLLHLVQRKSFIPKVAKNIESVK